MPQCARESLVAGGHGFRKREREAAMDSKQIKAAMALLEADGLIERTGEFRRGPKTGELQPVYRLTEKGNQRMLLERYPLPTPNEPSEANPLAALIASPHAFLQSPRANTL